MKLDDLDLFLSVVKAGSFAIAARQRAVPTSTLSRRIQQLESDTGRKLLLRHAKELSLTKDGQLLVQQFSSLFDDIHLRLENVDKEKEDFSGLIVINAPIIPLQHQIGPIALEFAKQHPQVQLRFQLGNQNDYYMRGDIDIALRFGHQPASDWVGRKLSHNPSILCATPSYLQNKPALTHPNQLSCYDLLSPNPKQRWVFTHTEDDTFKLSPNARIQSDELECIHNAALTGLGIARLPQWYATTSLQSGELVQLLPDWQMEGSDVFMLHPQRKLLSERTQALIDFIFQQWRPLDSCKKII
ncbi:LysR family transcriptional regulator [Photobacterium lipolyticum]|uniref:LysR family transcriptional regulator n=1 Tax=Photobacterium lipolyticum TaxID=266810 RepID=A0A2T3MS34_9GAMM|nr:LysR family transcriptional regulator [Photobacterium lipolyticum]PSW00125.1 LysR family transcriptional regulator [Photobacterium lipolyticum]